MWYLCVCVLNVSLTFKWYGPTKGAGFGLYKPRPDIKTGLVFQVDARVLLRCLSKTETPFVYMVDTCLLPEHIIVGLFSGLFFPFFLLFIWYFGFLDF